MLVAGVRTDRLSSRVSQKTKSADCLSARLLSFLVFLSTDLGSLRKSVFVLFVSQITVKSVCLSVDFLFAGFQLCCHQKKA
jgi:hypothetical protein